MLKLTSEIADLYHQLVSSKEEGLLIFRLHEKIKNGEFDANFSTQDIQRAVDETASLNIGSGPPLSVDYIYGLPMPVVSDYT